MMTVIVPVFLLLSFLTGAFQTDEKAINHKDATRTIATDSLPSEDFIHLYGGLDHFWSAVRNEQEATVAFLGGSITAGKGWRDKVMQHLKDGFPGTKWTFINAGIPSLGSVPHAFRLENDVLSQPGIDLLFIESAVNDRANGTPVLNQRRALEGIVRHARRATPSTDIVLMAFADEIKVDSYAAGKIPEAVKVHDDIARYYKLPFLNLAEEVASRIAAHEFTWKDDFRNLHPSPFGHHLYFRTIRTMLERSAKDRNPPPRKPAKLPRPLDLFNYDRGDYVSIVAAEKLKNFKVHASWTPDDGVSTRPGFVKVPVLEGKVAGATFELSFRGDAVGIAVVSGPDAGMIRYSIDGGEAETLDLFTQWSPSLHLPWYLLLEDGLKPGRHTLRVTVMDEHHPKSTGSACRIVHFLVNK